MQECSEIYSQNFLSKFLNCYCKEFWNNPLETISLVSVTVYMYVLLKTAVVLATRKLEMQVFRQL